MNCCKEKGWKSWLMVLGCLLPVIAVIALPLLGVKNTYVTWLAFLACPLAMGLMMFMTQKPRAKAAQGEK